MNALLKRLFVYAVSSLAGIAAAKLWDAIITERGRRA